MKTNNLFRIAVLAFGISLLNGCQNEALDMETSDKYEYTICQLGAFPLSKHYKSSQTRVADGQFDTDWENCSAVTLLSGKEVYLPWSEKGGSISLPFEYHNLLKKEDGWQLIYHSFAGSGNIEEGRNYMMFYNQRTGHLRIYYYVENDHDPNNHGFWSIRFAAPQKLLNASPELAIPANLGNISCWMGGNPSMEADRGFRVGWNGIQVLLAYDPTDSNEQRMALNTQSANIFNVNLLGDFSGYSQGTILTHGSTNPFTGVVNDLATVFGSEAGRWIDEHLTDSVKTKSPLLAGSVSAIAKLGFNKIFSSFIGTFSKPTVTVSDLEFKTKTNGTISGDIQFQSSTGIPPLSLPFNRNTLGVKLGAWNLSESPTIYINPIGKYSPGMYDIWLDECYYLFEYADTKCDVIFNPELEKHLISYKVEAEPVRCFVYGEKPENTVSGFDYGSLGTGAGDRTFSHITEQDLLYGKHGQSGALYRDKLVNDVYFIGIIKKYGLENGQPPQTINILENLDRIRGDYMYSGSNHHVKVSVTMVTDFEGKRDTTLSTRTYAPRIEWGNPEYQYHGLEDISM